MSVKIDLTDICLKDLDELNIECKDNIMYDNLVDNLLVSQPSFSFPKKEYKEEFNTVICKFPFTHVLSADSLNSEILLHYIDRLPEIPFSAHLSVNIVGKVVRLVYKEGTLIKVFDKDDIELNIEQRALSGFLELSDIDGLDYAEIRGVISSDNFIAYDFVGEDVEFETKQELYDYLEELGFEIPLYWVIDDLTKVTLRTELSGIVNDCEIELTADDEQNISGYTYETKGLIFTLNDIDKCKEIGLFNDFDLSSIVLKFNVDKVYTGIIQAIYWKPYKEELKPFALIADDIDVIKTEPYVLNLDDIENFENLGVCTENDLVTEIPLYNASNMIKLDAYIGNKIYFKERNDNVYPCYSDGLLVSERS